MKNCADTELIELIKSGDPLAFDELHARYWHVLFRIAYKKIGDADETDDLLQDMFIELWEKRESIAFNNVVESWLRNRLWFKIAGYFRLKGFNEKHLKDISAFLAREEAVIEINDLSRVHADSYYEEILQVISSGIEEMPGRMREVFNMNLSGNYTVKEIAAKLNIAPTTVKTHLERATAKLRKAVAEHPGTSLEYMFILWLINY